MGTNTEQIQNHVKPPHLSEGKSTYTGEIKALKDGEMAHELLWCTRLEGLLFFPLIFSGMKTLTSGFYWKGKELAKLVQCWKESNPGWAWQVGFSLWQTSRCSNAMACWTPMPSWVSIPSKGTQAPEGEAYCAHLSISGTHSGLTPNNAHRGRKPH